ncbi:MAG: hypothetical protein QM523_00590 [Candidatus Pacebacteria bacterium]|nr:hypothetical protein [Candidatus Paceibacterota bacterium]
MRANGINGQIQDFIARANRPDDYKRLRIKRLAVGESSPELPKAWRSSELASVTMKNYHARQVCEKFRHIKAFDVVTNKGRAVLLSGVQLTAAENFVLNHDQPYELKIIASKGE